MSSEVSNWIQRNPITWALVTWAVLAFLWWWNFGSLLPGLLIGAAWGTFNWWFARSGGGGERLRERVSQWGPFRPS